MEYSTILVRIRQIVRTVNVESKRLEREHGISIPQLLSLKFLDHSPDFKASHKQLKDYLQLNASTVTGIINRLETKGLVARLPKQQDMRVSYIRITDKGAQFLHNTPEPLHDKLKARLSQLSEEELDNLRMAFDTIIDFLKIDDLDAAPIVTGYLMGLENKTGQARKES